MKKPLLVLLGIIPLFALSGTTVTEQRVEGTVSTCHGNNFNDCDFFNDGNYRCEVSNARVECTIDP